MPKRLKLDSAPEGFRTGRASVVESRIVAAELSGGMFDAGIVPGVSLVTLGEALGHGCWLDAPFVESVGDQLQAAGDRGIKSRFTHPGMSSDGLGKMLGRINNGRVEGDRVIGDLHFSKSSHRTPDGDLAEYVAMLIEEDPKAAGLSIVFHRDREAEIAFAVEHGAEVFEDEYGQIIDFENFKSPDPLNTQNLPHVRLKELRAADLVDEPAANPEGMFDSTPIARDAEKFLAYALGVEKEKTVAEMFGISCDRAAAFASRFLSSKGLMIVSKDTTQAGEATKPEAKPEVTREQFNAELNRYIEKFGAENGSKWFASGKSFSEALELHIEALSARIKTAEDEAKAANEKLSSLCLGEKEILTGSQSGKDKEGKSEGKNLSSRMCPEEAK